MRQFLLMPILLIVLCDVMPLFFEAFADVLPTEEIIHEPDQKNAEFINKARAKMQLLFPDMNEKKWEDIMQTSSEDNFSLLHRNITILEKEYEKNNVQNDVFYVCQIHAYHQVMWRRILEYSKQEGHTDKIHAIWADSMKKEGRHRLLLLEVITGVDDLALSNKKLFTLLSNDIEGLKKSAWAIVEQSDNIVVLDLFLTILQFSHPLTEKPIANKDDIAKIDALYWRIDTRNSAGKFAAEYTGYARAIISSRIGLTTGIPAQTSPSPMFAEDIAALGPVKFLTGKELEENKKRSPEYKAKMRKELTQQRKEDCKQYIDTPSSRAILLVMLKNKNDKKVFEYQRDWNDYQDMAYKALRDCYRHAWSETIKRDRYSVYSAKGIQHVETYSGYTKNRLSITNRQEALTLLMIFQSEDAQAKQYAFLLMKESRCAGIAPELLKMISVQKPTLTNAEEHAKADFSTASSPNTIVPFLPIEPVIQAKKPEPIRRYHFLECDLLGSFGDENTVKSLKELQKKPDVAKELQEDIALMIENIEKELAEHGQWQKDVRAMRKLAREKKIAYAPSDPRFADLEKDDPEPVSPEGFRNWATTDGLFKVYAKFVSYDAKSDDVTLQKPDGKTTAIERSALRQIDQEYVKQREQK